MNTIPIFAPLPDPQSPPPARRPAPRRPRRSRRGGMDLYNVIFALLIVSVSIASIIGLYNVATGYLDAVSRTRLQTSIHAAMANLYQSRPGFGAAGAGVTLGDKVTTLVASYLPADDVGALDQVQAPDGENINIYENGKYYVVVFESVDADLCERMMKTFAGQSERRSRVAAFGVAAVGTTVTDTNSTVVESDGQEGFSLTEIKTECVKIDGFSDDVGLLAISRR